MCARFVDEDARRGTGLRAEALLFVELQDGARIAFSARARAAPGRRAHGKREHGRPGDPAIAQRTEHGRRNPLGASAAPSEIGRSERQTAPPFRPPNHDMRVRRAVAHCDLRVHCPIRTAAPVGGRGARPREHHRRAHRLQRRVRAPDGDRSLHGHRRGARAGPRRRRGPAPAPAQRGGRPVGRHPAGGHAGPRRARLGELRARRRRRLRSTGPGRRRRWTRW